MSLLGMAVLESIENILVDEVWQADSITIVPTSINTIPDTSARSV
jgi:hypothetical protein